MSVVDFEFYPNDVTKVILSKKKRKASKQNKTQLQKAAMESHKKWASLCKLDSNPRLPLIALFNKMVEACQREGA